MVKQLRNEGRRLRVFFPALMSVAFFCCSALGEEGAGAAVAARFRVHPMKKISAEQGVEYLQEVGIAVTTSKLKDTNTLLVTSDNQLALAKASAVLNLVDVADKYAVAPIATASEANDVPLPDQLQNMLPDMAVGTFLSPPRGERPVKAIMDVQGDMVIVIAPANHLERIFAAVKQYRASAKAAATAIGPTAQVVIGPNEVVVKEGAAPEAAQEATQEATQKENYEDELFGDLTKSLDAERLKRRPAASRPAAPAPGEITEQPMEQPAGQPTGAAPETEGELAEQLRNLMQQQGGEEGQTVGEAAEEPESAGVEGEEPEMPEVGEKAEVKKIQSYEPTFDFDTEEEIKLQLPETFEIMMLLDLAGKYLHLDYIYDAQQLKDVTVNMKLNGELEGSLKLGQLYPLVEATLMMKGFVMTRSGNIVWVRPKDAILQGAVPIISDGNQVEAGNVIATRVFKLRHIDTTNAKNLLDGMQLGEQIIEVPEQGALFVVGYTSQMARMERLLEIVDKPGKPKKFRFRQLRYTMAETIAPTIESLAEQLGTVSITIAQPTSTTGVAPPRGARVTRPPVPPRQTPPPQMPPQPGGTAAMVGTPSVPTVYLDADARTNRVLMIGLDEQLDIVEELVEALDVEQQDLRTLRLYDMQFVEAEDVRAKLEELGIVSALRETTRRSSRMRDMQQQAAARIAQQGGQPPNIPQTNQPGQTVEEMLSEEPQVVVIESTNSLLVNATPAQQAQVATIIGYVDSETLEASKPYRIYSLENQDPESMAETLTKLIQESVKDETAKTETIVRKTEEDIVIVPDKNTFSLIVYASKKNQEWIENLIKVMDRRRPQVLIDCTLVEVSRSDDFDYDLQIATNFGSDAPLLPVVGQVQDLAKVPFPLGNPPTTEAFTPSGSAFYSDDKIQVLLEALQTKSYGRILAKPKILVNDNEKGNIKTTNTTYVSIQGAVATEGGAAVNSQDFQSYEAGINLEITPHISEGDLLRLEIVLGRSDFLPTADVTVNGQKISPPPNKVATDLDTIVTVPDGSTIILGGLLKLNQTKGGSRVPILSYIPIVGGLFKTIGNSDTESKLYVFVKAHILRPAEGVRGLPEMEQISDENRAAFEEFENDFQSYEDWPGISPKPMPPVKVLEAR